MASPCRRPVNMTDVFCHWFLNKSVWLISICFTALTWSELTYRRKSLCKRLLGSIRYALVYLLNQDEVAMFMIKVSHHLPSSIRVLWRYDAMPQRFGLGRLILSLRAVIIVSCSWTNSCSQEIPNSPIGFMCNNPRRVQVAALYTYDHGMEQILNTGMVYLFWVISSFVCFHFYASPYAVSYAVSKSRMS